MKVYISGPMTGMPGLNAKAFEDTAKTLRACGYDAVNPHEVDTEPGKAWADYMRSDIKALCDCDAVCTLLGWERSRGARLEVHIAHQLGMRIEMIDGFPPLDAPAKSHTVKNDPEGGTEGETEKRA